MNTVKICIFRSNSFFESKVTILNVIWQISRHEPDFWKSHPSKFLSDFSVLFKIASWPSLGHLERKLIQKAEYKNLKIFHDFLDRFLEKSSTYGRVFQKSVWHLMSHEVWPSIINADLWIGSRQIRMDEFSRNWSNWLLENWNFEKLVEFFKNCSGSRPGKWNFEKNWMSFPGFANKG